jgi:FAD/FMN-containing dehydrogenase
VTAEDSPDLFWAMRGAGGNFGVVTSIEADLVAVPELYAGGLFFPGEDRADVLAAFVESVSTAPDALSLSVAVYTFPDLPTLPAAVRGRHCCHIRVTHQGSAAEAESFLGAIRGAGSVLLDTVRPLLLTEIGTIHNDRTAPLDVHSRSLVLRGLDQGLVDTVIAHTAPDAASLVELRHLGGALARPPAVANAVGHRGGVANMFTTAYPTDDHTVADAEQQRLLDDLEPWSDGGALSTFLSERRSPRPMSGRRSVPRTMTAWWS